MIFKKKKGKAIIPPKPKAEHCRKCGRKKKLKLVACAQRYDTETGEPKPQHHTWEQSCSRLSCKISNSIEDTNHMW